MVRQVAVNHPTEVQFLHEAPLAYKIYATDNTDLALKLPSARPNIEASFLTALSEARDIWLAEIGI